MGRTRIELLSSGDIDMYDDVATPLNFAIADIREPDKRNASFSKTIKVPGTKGNNKRFGHIFDVNIGDGTFNPNLRSPCTLYIDDVAQLSGNLQVLSIDIDDDKKIEYSVCIKGQVGTIFSDLANTELTDIDLSAFNHVYSYAVQTSSWTNTYLQGYCYPLIDYGFDSNLASVNVEHLLPAVFLRTYIDKIFASQGYTYTSSFFDSAFFKNLIVPSNAAYLGLTTAQVASRLFDATQTSATTGTTISTGLTLDVLYNNEVNDPSGNYDPATGIWTVVSTGYYDITATTTVSVNMSSAGFYSEDFRIMKSPSGSALYNSIADTYNPLTLSSGASSHSLYVGASNIFLSTGDKIKIQHVSATGTGITATTSLNSGEFKNAVVNSGVLETDTLDMNSTIPKKIKQKDFLLSVIKMFNLYIDVDKNNVKNLIIETRNDFYSSGSITDWSYKLDNSNIVELKPMGDLNYREFIYSYTDDSDYYNTKYKTKYNETYGRYRKVVDNDFLTGVSDNKVIFSPTPLIGDTASDRVISRIWDIDSANIVHQKSFNIRLLYNGGIKTSNVAYNYVGRQSGNHLVTQYLYAGHVDNPVLPTLDLSFGTPNEIYYTTSYYTDNNIYNKYLKSFVDQITDKNSKIVTAYFYLTPYDIQNIDFRNKFYFDNQYFYLNKIYDYNPIDSSVTKCEFIRVKDVGTFVPSSRAINGGFGVATLGFPSIAGGSLTSNNANPVGASKSMVAGSDNILDPSLKEVILLGNNNVIGNSTNVSLIGSSGCIVGSGSNNVTLLNSSGCIINPGLTNITLINTNDVTITSGDSLYVGGQRIPTGTIKSYKANISQSGTNAPTESYVFNNYIGGVTYSYVSTGIYDMTFDSAYMPTQSKVIINCGVPPITATNTFRASWVSSSVIRLRTHQGSNVLNGVLSNTLFEIIIYS